MRDDGFYEQWEDLGEADLEPPKFVIEELLPVGMTVLASPPKSYKSTLEMVMALLIAGVKVEVLPPNFYAKAPGSVLIQSFEATAGELRHMCEQEMGVTVPNNGRVFIARDPWRFRLDDLEQVNKLLHWLEIEQPRAFMLDPLRYFHAFDENDSGLITQALGPLQRWAKDSGAAFLVVHHTKKRTEGHNTATDIRGTSALFGMADGCLILTRKADETIHIDATFKRAPSWARTLTLAAYARKGESPSEELGEVENEVLRLIAGGAENLADVAKQLRRAKSRVVSAVEKLERNRLVVKRKGKWVVK